MAARNISLTWSIPAFTQMATVYQGEAVTLTFTAATVTSMVGWTVTFVLKRFHTDASILLTVTPTITDSTNGVFTVTLTAAQTGTTLAYIQSYPFDIWRTDSGAETELANGLVSIQETTKNST